MQATKLGKPHVKILLWLLYKRVGKKGAIVKAIRCHDTKYFDELFQWGMITITLSLKDTKWRRGTHYRLTRKGELVVKCAIMLLRLMGVRINKMSDILSNDLVMDFFMSCASLLRERRPDELNHLLKLLCNIKTAPSQL